VSVEATPESDVAVPRGVSEATKETTPTPAARHTGTWTKCFDLANALRANFEDHNRDAPGTTPTSLWLTPPAPSDRIDTVTMPRGSEKVLGNTVPRGAI